MNDLRQQSINIIRVNNSLFSKLMLLYILIIWLFPIHISAQQTLPYFKIQNQFSRNWDYKLVSEVLKQLRYYSRENGDMELFNLLQNVRLEVPLKSRFESNPNAFAFKDEQANWILIESNWMSQVAGFADLGALYSLASFGSNYAGFASDIFYKFCEDYKKNYNTELLAGRPIPTYNFKFEDYINRSDPKYAVDYILFDKLSGLVATNTWVWTILHEAGHHALKHTTTNRAYTNEGKRQHEYDADFWAFTKMKELGYSLFGIDNFMTARGMTEICFGEVELFIDEEASSHPRWGNREIALRQKFDPVILAEQSLHIYGIPMGIPHAVLTTLVVPDPSQGSCECTLIQGGSQFMGLVEWQGNSATVYCRDNIGGRLEFYIEDISHITVSIKQRQYNSDNHLTNTMLLPSIQGDLVFFDFLEYNGMKYYDIRKRLKGDNLFIIHLRRTGASELQIQKVLEEAHKMQDEKCYYGLQYQKDLISFYRLTEVITQKANEYEANLIEILGEYSYNEFIDSYTKDMERYTIPLQGLDVWEEELFNSNF